MTNISGIPMDLKNQMKDTRSSGPKLLALYGA